MQASLPWAWQRPAISQPVPLTKTSVARVSPELVSSVFQQCLYLSFFPFKKINPKASSESCNPWKDVFLSVTGVCVHLRKAGLGLGGGGGGDLLPIGAPWTQVA